jgi:hypothetical protein
VEHEIRNRPKLAARILVVPKDVNSRIDKRRTYKRADRWHPAPNLNCEKRAPEDNTVINGNNALPDFTLTELRETNALRYAADPGCPSDHRHHWNVSD